jgi:hypothetical protein
MCMPQPKMPPTMKMPDAPPPPLAPPPPSASASEVVKGKDRDEDLYTKKKKTGGSALRISKAANASAQAPGLNIAH